MTKKDKVRAHIEKMQGGSIFNLRSIAGKLNVDVKDVSNVVQELKQAGIVEGEVKVGHKHMTYTLIKNVQNAVALKKAVRPKPPIPLCNCDTAAIKAGKPHSASCPRYVAPKKPAKRRTPFLIAIDDEIKRMEQRIALLRKTRKEFE